jgi:hypothetical protein
LTKNTTDDSGTVVVSMTAGDQTGLVTLKATSGTVSQSVVVTQTEVPSTVNIGAITIIPTPEQLISIPADGVSSTPITVNILDPVGNPVPYGTVVYLSTDLGSFPNEDPNFDTNKAPGGAISVVKLATQNGTVQTSLQAGSTPGTAAITAWVNEWGTLEAVSQSTTIEFTGGGLSVNKLELRIDSTTIPADGSSQTKVYATALTADNQIVPDVAVNFRTCCGTYDGVSCSFPGECGCLANGTCKDTPSTFTCDRYNFCGNISTPHNTGAADSDNPGVAIATLTSDRYQNKNITVIAESQGVSTTATVAFTGIQLSITADPDNLLADQNYASRLSIELVDAADNPIPEADVLLETDQSYPRFKEVGDIPANGQSNNYLVKTDTSGKKEVDFYFYDPVGGLIPPAFIRGTARGYVAYDYEDPDATQDDLLTVSFSQYLMQIRFVSPLVDCPVIENPDDPPDDDEIENIIIEQSAKACATIYKYETGSPEDIGAGTPVEFSSSLGTMQPADGKVVTDTNGIASVLVVAGSQSGVATVDADALVVPAGSTTEFNLTAKKDLPVLGGVSDKIVVTVSPDVIPVAQYNGQTTVTAQVFDENDNPSADKKVYFRIGDGAPGGGEYLSKSVATTGADGIARVIFYSGTLPSEKEGVVIEAYTFPNFPPESPFFARVTIAGPPHGVGVSVNLVEIFPDGGHIVVPVTAIIKDVNGNPVVDGTQVHFSVEAIAFDEDRDYDYTINCWTYTGNDKVDLTISPLQAGYPCSTSRSAAGFGTSWFSDDTNRDGKTYQGYLSEDLEIFYKGPMAPTEDVNDNGILDFGEDKNDNGVLDPINGCVVHGLDADGNEIDPGVTISGLAAGQLVYPMSHAENIKVRVSAEAGGVKNFYEYILICWEDMVESGTCGIYY